MADDRIYRLVYYSRSRIGAPGTLPGTIDSILKTSQQHNAASNITGALMFNAACFGQVLEGPRAALSALFDRIQRDPRHNDVTLLAFDPIDSRSFPDWSMAFVGTRPDDAAMFSEIGTASGFDPTQVSGDTLLASLRALALSGEAPSH